MARRPRERDDDVSLFPFLSIIACVIGVLTMMISTLTLAQMDSPDVALIESHEKVAKELSEAESEVARIRSLIDEQLGPDATRVREEIEISQQELEELAAELKKTQQELEKQKQTKVVIPELDPSDRESLADMQGQLKRVTDEIAQLEVDLSERKAAGEAEVTIVPSGSGVNFRPHFIECAADSIVLHTMDPPKRIRAANMVTDIDFLAVLEAVANGPNDSVIFLLRSDGLNTYRAASRLCNEREIRNGKLPAVGEGRLDLSRFATQKDQ